MYHCDYDTVITVTTDSRLCGVTRAFSTYDSLYISIRAVSAGTSVMKPVVKLRMVVMLLIIMVGVIIMATVHYSSSKRNVTAQSEAAGKHQSLPNATEPHVEVTTVPSDKTVITPVISTTPSPQPSQQVAPTQTVDPIEQLHQTVLSKAATVYTYPYVASSSPDADTFATIQWQCLGRGLSSSTPQSTLDELAAWLDPTTDAAGVVHYKFFTGGCRVVSY